MRYLAAREHSVLELENKLRRKGHPTELVAQVLHELREQGLQSDQRYLESYIHSRIGKGYGPILIRSELRQRGIDEELLDEELTQSGDYWTEIAKGARRKKFGGQPPASRDDWNRQARFLARRGFPSDLIFRTLGEVSD